MICQIFIFYQRSVYKYFTYLIVILLSVSCSDTSSLGSRSGDADVAIVEIRPNHVIEVNGVDEIPDGIFGVTAYNGAGLVDNSDWHRVLGESGIRWVGLPGVAAWAFPQERPELLKGWATSASGDAAVRTKSVHQGYAIPHLLNAWRAIGMTPMLYLRGYPKWVDQHEKVRSVPLDGVAEDEVAKLMAEYVALCLRADPELKWVHFLNEPNAHWFKAKRSGDDYARLYTKVAKAVRERNPSVLMGGPVLCWPPSWSPNSNWYTWEGYSLPLIEAAGDQLDFFDYHLYDTNDPLVAIGETQLAVNAMYNESGQHKPVLITEYGNYLTEDDISSPNRLWDMRLLPWQRQIMAILDYAPDKIVSLQAHDLRAQVSGQFRILKGSDPNDQYDFLKQFGVWRDLTGQRILAASSSSQIRAYAAVDQDFLAIVLVNTSSLEQGVDLQVLGDSMITGLEAERSIRIERSASVERFVQTQQGLQNTELGGVVGEGESAEANDHNFSYSDSVASIEADDAKILYNDFYPINESGRLLLKPNETRALKFKIEREPINSRRVIHEYFGDRVHVSFPDIGASETFIVKLDEATLDAADVMYRLRVAQLGAREGDRLEMRIGETRFILDAAYFQEFEIPRDLIDQGPLELNVSLLERGSPDLKPSILRLSSVSVITVQETKSDK